MNKIKLNEIMTNKMSGQYDYKLNDTFYQIYKYEQYWIVFETKEEEGGVPFDWRVISPAGTLKEAKLTLETYINRGK